MSRFYMLLLSCFFLSTGCSLFKKTSKTVSQNQQYASKQSYLDKSSITTRQKESHTFTWWQDSILHQHQYVKEQANQVKTENLKTAEQTRAKQKLTGKTSEPVMAWVYAGIAAMLAGCYLIYKKAINSS